MLSRNSLIENFKTQLPQGYIIITTETAFVVGREDLKELLKEISSNDLTDLPLASPAMKGRLPVRLFSYPGGSAVVRQASHGGFFKWRGEKFLSSRRFFGELLASEHLRKNGVPTPRIIALKIQQDGIFQRAWIITDLVQNAVSLKEHIAVADKEEQKIILQKTAKLLRKMHDAEIFHSDFHIGNILVSDENPILIDLDSAKVFNRISAFKRAMNLARFLRSLEKLRALENVNISKENIGVAVGEYRENQNDGFLTIFLTGFRVLNYILFPFRKIIWRL